MKKFLNDPANFVDEMLQGILLAHPDFLKEAAPRALVRADAPVKGKVAIITGGGSGHLPVFLGYVGKGLAHGVAVGNVFSSPSAEQILAATKAAHGGAGVLFLYGNYMGDILNFDMAKEMAEFEDMEVRTVRVTDDVASAPPQERTKRRGVAGLFYAYKIAGAASERGYSLDEVERLAQKTVDNVRSMGVALTPCTVPAAGKPTFSIGEDEMEIGMGIHGEPGVMRGKIQSADEVAGILTERILEDLGVRSGDDVSILVNSLGATPPEELYIIYRKVHELVAQAGLKIHRVYIGEYATSLEMAGCSLTVLKLDQELTSLLDDPAYSPFFVQPGGANRC
ncbi:MAG: dihydroxyacetone kinase subunit DhaK [Firmicutes bacterium]|nr:dihydroxyacetone kinase subunit DhaK [Bacillota bacterium]